MSEREPDAGSAARTNIERTAAARFRSTLVRVMSVQVVTLVLLWLLQRAFTH